MRKIHQKLEEILKKPLLLLWRLLSSSLRCRNSREDLHQQLLHRYTIPGMAVQWQVTRNNGKFCRHYNIFKRSDKRDCSFYSNL
uniref:Uncharacterized protein n=1 Tax=Rhizophora mucronata TaxID=61149 RepID=A0A2P2M4D4_RHIMU